MENCKRSCAHKVQSILSSESSTEHSRFHNKSIENLICLQGHVTPKWLIRSSRNLNSSEMLCLSWLPASLMKIQLKKNELAWGRHFPIISLWEIFQLKGTYLYRGWSDLAEIRTYPRFYACPRYLQVWKRSDQIKQRKGGDIIFPIISQ